MKKILISILIVLLLILTYVVLDKGINIGSFRINSIKDIKNDFEEMIQNDCKEFTQTSYKKFPWFNRMIGRILKVFAPLM